MLNSLWNSMWNENLVRVNLSWLAIIITLSLYIYIQIYIYYIYIVKWYINIYIYSDIRLIVVISLRCSIGRAKSINITNGWIKQQDNSSTLIWVSCFLQSSGVHIHHIRFSKRKNNRIKILFWQNIQKQKFKPDFNPYCPLHFLAIIYSDGSI